MLLSVARKRLERSDRTSGIERARPFLLASHDAPGFYCGCSFQSGASLSGVQRQNFKVAEQELLTTLLPFEQLDVGTNFEQWWRSELHHLSVDADTSLLSADSCSIV